MFFELIQIALGHRSGFSHVPTEGEWRELLVLAKRQTLIGVCYAAIEKLPPVQRPPRQMLLQWFAAAESIRLANAKLNDKAVEIAAMFRNDGFRNVVLKGQGVAQYYRVADLDGYRVPGDIDIWLEGTRKDIVSYVRNRKRDCKVVYHHVDFPEVDGVEVEVHYTPSWMNCYFTNRRLQRFFDEQKEGQFGNVSDGAGIPVPTLAFNRVYILVHIYRHLFNEGIGLRQLMDYYFVLQQGFTEEERTETVRILISLRMERFASAVMWVLNEVFRMESRFLLIEPDEKEGCLLLKEIMRAGNMGHYDKSLARGKDDSSLLWGLRKLRRVFRFVYSYPSEVMWSPLFKLWHFFWRKRWNLY